MLRETSIWDRWSILVLVKKRYQNKNWPPFLDSKLGPFLGPHFWTPLKSRIKKCSNFGTQKRTQFEPKNEPQNEPKNESNLSSNLTTKSGPRMAADDNPEQPQLTTLENAKKYCRIYLYRRWNQHTETFGPKTKLLPGVCETVTTISHPSKKLGDRNQRWAFKHNSQPVSASGS